MKAWVLNDIGSLEFMDISKPQLKSGEALVRVKACGICGSDIPRVFVNGAHNMPLIPGHEFSGVVENVYETENNEWIGKRVGVFPLIPCRKCSQCMSGHTELCRNYDYLGSRSNGGFADYVAVPVANLIELPDVVSDDAAAMLEPASVAVHAIRCAGLLHTNADGIVRDIDICKNKKILVSGLGAIGMLVIRILKDAGFKNLYAIGNKDTQYRRFVESGLDGTHFCNSSKVDVPEWVSENIVDADVFFECIGNNDSLRYSVECTAPLGQIVLVGNPHSDVELRRQAYWKILRNQLHVAGTWNSSFNGTDGDDWHYVLSRIAAGFDIEKLITHRLAIDNIYDGFVMMRDKTEDYCKVMMINY